MREAIANMTCEVCQDEPAVGVAAIPFVPMSVAYGRRCLDANAHPYNIVVINTALADGYDSCVEEWQQIVDDTLTHLNKTREEFDQDVNAVIVDIERMHQEMREDLHDGQDDDDDLS